MTGQTTTISVVRPGAAGNSRSPPTPSPGSPESRMSSCAPRADFSPVRDRGQGQDRRCRDGRIRRAETRAETRDQRPGAARTHDGRGIDMLRRLVEFSLSQRLFTLLIAVLVAAAGAYAFLRIPIDAFPNIAQVQVKIILKAPGMTPAEVETRVVAPLEMELLGIPRKTILRSSAKYAIADLTVDFEDGTDIYWARQQVAERFAAVRPDLPAQYFRRSRADLDAAVRRVHVHRRGRGRLARRAPHPARLDHPAGAAHHSRRRRRQCARRLSSAPSRSRRTARLLAAAGLSVADLDRRRSRPTTATTARAG